MNKEKFMQQVETYVESLVSNGPKAIESVKRIIDSAAGMPETEALALEKEQAVINILSGQCIEGISAFLEKRAPKWQS